MQFLELAGFLASLIKKKANLGLILAVSAIMAGAIGNIIDSAFYGMIFSESFNQPAILFPPGGGYSSFLHGRVVDMFYFPIINTHWPDWSPFRPGESFVFFRPVFNIADSAITCGVFSIILFQKKMFNGSFLKEIICSLQYYSWQQLLTQLKIVFRFSCFKKIPGVFPFSF